VTTCDVIVLDFYSAFALLAMQTAVIAREQKSVKCESAKMQKNSNTILTLNLILTLIFIK